MPVKILTYQPSDAKLKALVYGPSGIGKTTLGATAPKALFVSAEAGLLSVADKSVQFAEIKSLNDLRDVYDFLKKGGHGYETVVIDSLTEIQNFIIANITGGKGMPQKGQWSDFGFEMNKILRAYRDLPMHVIFLALEVDKGGDEDGEKSMYLPDLYGKVRTAGAAFMDFVGRMSFYNVQEGDKRVSKRGICFTANERWLAKDRSGHLPSFVEPDFSKILEVVGTITTGESTLITSVENKSGQTLADLMDTIKTLGKDLGKDEAAVLKEFGISDGQPTPQQASQIVFALNQEKKKLSKELDANSAS